MLAAMLTALALAQGAPQDASAALRDVLAEARRAHGFPAAAVRVARRGETLAAAVVGTRVAGGADAATLDDRFHLGSVTKPLTATLVATLVDEGRLRWDETLEELFPNRPVHRALRGVTLAQLLSHRSGVQGLRDAGEIEAALHLYGDAASQRAQLAGWLIAHKPEHAPGEFHYSNAGPVIAAAAAERVTGVAYETLMRTRVFEPLAMKSAGFGWPAAAHPDAPWGHRLRGATPVPQDPHGAYEVNPALAPAADAHMSVIDLGRFLDDQARGLAGGHALLRTETYRRMHSEGIGWMARATPPVSEHEGSAETFFAIAAIGRDDGLTLALVLNDADAVAANELARAIFARFREAAPRRGGG